MSFPVPDMIFFSAGEFDSLLIVFTFIPDISTQNVPALDHWHCTVNGTPTAALEHNWIDEHSFQVWFDYAEPQWDDVVMLGWSPVSTTLQTSDGWAYTAWEPQAVPAGF